MKTPFLKFLAISAVFAGSISSASTFVGNGGNIGDIELRMTRQQLESTFTAIAELSSSSQKGSASSSREGQSNEQDDLCTCSLSFEGRPLCDMLKALSEPQVRFCSRYLKMKAPELAKALQDAGDSSSRQSRIQYNWTQEVIEVKENGKLRGADAVTNFDTMTMTLNQPGFLNMSVDERAFLVGHELFHLTRYEGEPLTDEGTIGPFVGKDGRRQLINALAASLVMSAHEIDAFRATSTVLNRSQASREYWVSLGGYWFSPKYNSENPYGVDRLSGGEISGRYQFTPKWGVLADVRTLRGSRSRLTQIHGDEDRQAIGVGVAYRWFPKDDPLTFWGQAHFVFSATVDSVKSSYTLQSAHTWMKESANGYGATLGVKYFIPFQKNFWGYAGASFSEQRLRFPETDIQYDGGSAATLGVSYAF